MIDPCWLWSKVWLKGCSVGRHPNPYMAACCDTVLKLTHHPTCVPVLCRWASSRSITAVGPSPCCGSRRPLEISERQDGPALTCTEAHQWSLYQRIRGPSQKQLHVTTKHFTVQRTHPAMFYTAPRHTQGAAGGSIVVIETVSLDKRLLPRAVRLTLKEQSTLCYLCLADKESFWLGESWTTPLCPCSIQESVPRHGWVMEHPTSFYCLFIGPCLNRCAVPRKSGFVYSSATCRNFLPTCETLNPRN